VHEQTGNMLMVAREEWNNSSNFAFDAFDEHIKPVSSAHLTTKHKFDFQYGRVCIKAKMPGGRGLWPQVTLLPEDPSHGTTAEIKVAEFMSISRKKYSNNILKSGLMFGGRYPNVARAKNKTVLAPEEHPAFTFNEYCADWGPERIVWTVNGRKYGEQTRWHQTVDDENVLEKPAPFNEAFYISLKVAVGVNWVSKYSRGATSLPSAMEVEHVKVWQRKC
jgi:beta-glucanase (GH16 family)